MKARVISDKDHLIGKLFQNFFDCEFYSRRTGFDLTSKNDIKHLVKETDKYDWTINLATGMPFGSVNLLIELENYCHETKIKHNVFNIGSYINLVLLNMPHSGYDVNKAALKYTHRKIANEFLFHKGTLDSRLLNLNYIEQLSTHVAEDYPHVNVLTIESIEKNINFMLENHNIKELFLQYNQPGNHRVNDGVGNLLAGIF